MGKIILITGYVAGGKTTFSLDLAKSLNIPVFNKDTMKAALSGSIQIQNREDSKNLSAATFDIMAHAAECLMKAEVPFILESNFKPSEADRLQQLIRTWHYQALSFVFVGDLHVLHRRFLARDNSPDREEANRIHGLFDDYSVFEKSIRPLGDFHVGNPVIKIDTTSFDTVDFDYYKEQARRFMASQKPRGILHE